MKMQQGLINNIFYSFQIIYVTIGDICTCEITACGHTQPGSNQGHK